MDCCYTEDSNSKPRVTIAVALYNSGKYVKTFIENISKQTFSDYELLFVVDHKTTDDTVDVIEQNKEAIKGSHRIIMQDDEEGLGGARNIGIDHSSGEIIWFVDVDDYQYPSFLEEMIDIMDENDADIVFCNHYQELKKVVPTIPDVDFGVKKFSMAEVLENFSDFPVYSWSRIQKKRIFESGNAFFKPYKTMEDLEQTIMSIMECSVVCYYEKPLCVYYKTPNTASKRNRCYDASVVEQTARSVLPKVAEKSPGSLEQFRRRMLEYLMRQMAFVDYRTFKQAYRDTIAHEMIENEPRRTKEMKIFEFSGTLYYCLIFIYTHHIWDNYRGMWKKV